MRCCSKKVWATASFWGNCPDVDMVHTENTWPVVLDRVGPTDSVGSVVTVPLEEVCKGIDDVRRLEWQDVRHTPDIGEELSICSVGPLNMVAFLDSVPCCPAVGSVPPPTGDVGPDAVGAHPGT